MIRLAVPLLLLSLPAVSPTPPVMAQTPKIDRFVTTPDHQRRYNDCMAQARREPLKALPIAEKWMAEGGGLGARHCVALAMYEAGRHLDAAVQLEAIARDLGKDRPALRAELWSQAGQAWLQAGQAENAAAAQSIALDLKPDDVDLWIDRGLSHAAMKAWPRAISDFDRALSLRADNLDVVILRAAAWRNAGNATKALADAERALKLAPDYPDALIERGFARRALGDQHGASVDFNLVLRLAPAGSDAAKRAQAGLGISPPPATPQPAAKPGEKR